MIRQSRWRACWGVRRHFRCKHGKAAFVYICENLVGEQGSPCLQEPALRPGTQAAEAAENVDLAGFVQLEAHGIPPSSKYWIHDYYYIMPGNICIAIKNTFDTPIIVIMLCKYFKASISRGFQAQRILFSCFQYLMRINEVTRIKRRLHACGNPLSYSAQSLSMAFSGTLWTRVKIT
jgi:hypothetical protein